MDTIAERVARGAALLDERRPGWAVEIDTGHLEMDCPNFCILGQIYGRFDTGCEALSIDQYAPRGLVDSFEVLKGNADVFPADAEYAALQAAWLAAIAARLTPEPAWQPEPQEAELCPA